MAYVGLSAGRGTLEVAAQNLGGDVAMLAEKGPVARVLLRLKFPNALIDEDFDDEDWRNWRRNSTAALGLFAGPPCGPYAPSGKGRFLSGPRARYLPGIGAATCAYQPETIDVETHYVREALYATADDDGAHALAEIN